MDGASALDVARASSTQATAIAAEVGIETALANARRRRRGRRERPGRALLAAAARPAGHRHRPPAGRARRAACRAEDAQCGRDGRRAGRTGGVDGRVRHRPGSCGCPVAHAWASACSRARPLATLVDCRRVYLEATVTPRDGDRIDADAPVIVRLPAPAVEARGTVRSVRGGGLRSRGRVRRRAHAREPARRYACPDRPRSRHARTVGRQLLPDRSAGQGVLRRGRRLASAAGAQQPHPLSPVTHAPERTRAGADPGLGAGRSGRAPVLLRRALASQASAGDPRRPSPASPSMLGVRYAVWRTTETLVTDAFTSTAQVTWMWLFYAAEMLLLAEGLLFLLMMSRHRERRAEADDNQRWFARQPAGCAPHRGRARPHLQRGVGRAAEDAHRRARPRLSARARARARRRQPRLAARGVRRARRLVHPPSRSRPRQGRQHQPRAWRHAQRARARLRRRLRRAARLPAAHRGVLP